MIHLVTLSRNPTRQMPAFLAELKDRAEGYYWRVMPNVWLVDTDDTTKELSAALRQHISTRDTLLVIQAQENYDGWLTKDTWDWLNSAREHDRFSDSEGRNVKNPDTAPPSYPRGDDALVQHPDALRRWAFVCVCVGCKSGHCDGLPTQPCGRAQSYAPADRDGGVTVEEAQELGWRKTDRGWICPFCSGEDDGLRKVFARSWWL